MAAYTYNRSQLEAAYDSLMRGLTELDFRGSAVPCNLILIGDHSFPLAMNSQGQVLAAASLYGSGRIVVLSHESYLTTLPALVENALTWLRGEESENPCVGIHTSVKAVADNLSSSTLQAQVVSGFSSDLKVGVYVTKSYNVAASATDLVAFLKSGGGVLMGGQAWHWSSVNRQLNALHSFPGNKVSGVTGIYFSKDTAKAECLTVYPDFPCSWQAVVVGKSFEDDLEFLLHGISEFDVKGPLVASEVLVHGPLAFSIGTTSDTRAFLAGAYYGQGRVIVATHEGLLGRQTWAPFWHNAIHWLDEGRQGIIGVEPSLKSVSALLSKFELKCELTGFRKDLSVYICKAYSDAHAKEIQEFVAEGGGLMIGGHAWNWAHKHKEQNHLTDFPGNKILNKMGFTVLKKTLPRGCYSVPTPGEYTKNSYHFRQSLNRFACHVTMGSKLADHEEAHLKKLSEDCSLFLHMKANTAHYTQLMASLIDIIKKSGMPQVSGKCPVRSPKDHLLLHVGTELYRVCPDPDALLPYLIKDNPSMPVVRDQSIKVNVDTAGAEEWISTGLYLCPGMRTYIAMPEEIVNKNWKVQIGCQTDHLKAQELKRAPCVHTRFAITKDMMEVHNLWGGLIYLVAPPKTKVEGAEFKVQMAVLAPYYKSGVTTLDDWLRLRTAAAPWAELEFENIILTLPSDCLRDMERPDLLAALWDKIMRGIADLAVIPHKFSRKQRFVADIQISHGLMHAGYPIMAKASTARKLVTIDPAAPTSMWGIIHELGHNQQRGCWEFPPHTTECTCNLWSVYVHEEVLGINRVKAHPAMADVKRTSRIKQYVGGGRDLSKWTTFVALETYLQLQEEFGWDALKKVFAAYHSMSVFPNTKDAKMNLYAETFSQAVGRNLSGFFKAWGWPIQTATEEKLSHLPPWQDHPMVQYD